MNGAQSQLQGLVSRKCCNNFKSLHSQFQTLPSRGADQKLLPKIEDRCKNEYQQKAIHDYEKKLQVAQSCAIKTFQSLRQIKKHITINFWQ
ncbi:hypothetical protein FGO68_gene1891 [Halteria grandinella]|uniref:Uncharacterized protein n=1 Tax=Halteria grandinella TaxID=5974 RepID=A0A8J8SZJ8_HALGN|nr:hypothetical protein FGO68_gene1891 [Halteria grandinella]